MINIETGQGGRVYQIWQQQQATSCGVASAWMARGIARQMSFAEEEWALAQRIYTSAVNSSISAASSVPSAPMSIDPNAFRNTPANQLQSTFSSTFSVAGLTFPQLAAALRADGLQVLVKHNNGAPITVEHNRIAYNKPAISFVKWPDVNRPGDGGAHFVVVGRCTAQHVTFLDPWTGHLREQPNNAGFRGGYNAGNLLVHLYIWA